MHQNQRYTTSHQKRALDAEGKVAALETGENVWLYHLNCMKRLRPKLKE